MRNKKILLLILFLVLPLFPSLFAAVESLEVVGYSIAGYQFEITGKTKEFALRRDIVPSAEPVYGSEEELLHALEVKRQVLMNRRLFNEVSYTYTLTALSGDIAWYDVVFTVKDASTIFALPYPKYSTDEGIRIGVRGNNKNLFGTYSQLSFVMNTTQTGDRNPDNFWDWSKREDFVKIEVDDLLLGSALLDIDAEYKGRIPSHGSYDLDINVRDIPLWGGTKLRFNPSLKGTLAKNQPITINEYGLITDFGVFDIGDEKLSWYNELKLTGGTIPQALSLVSTMRQHELSVFSHPISFSLTLDGATGIRENDEWVFKPTKLKIGPNLGTTFALPFNFSWNMDLGARLNVPQNDPASSTYWLLFNFSHTLSRSRINWKDNFRTGSELTLKASLDWNMLPEVGSTLTPEEFKWTVEGQLRWFPFATSFLNPSLRILGHYSSTARALLPITDDTYKMADYMRGILESNNTAASRNLAVIANLNLTARFINLGNFAKTYISPFVDFGIFSNNPSLSKEDYDWLGTVGFEGIGIINKFPGFPIRASLGLNAKDLFSYARKQIPATKIEYEIFFGMDFFF